MNVDKSKIGAIKATSLVAGNMIGSGVLLAPAILAPYGSLSIIGWILTTLGALGLALAFVYLSKWIPRSGGPYTFAKHVFGDFVGFQMAWGYWISCWCGSVSLLVGGLQYLSMLYPDLTSNSTFSICFCVLVVLLFTIINRRGISASTFYSVIIMAIKILPLIIIAIAGFFCVESFDFFNFKDINSQSFSAFGAMAPTLLWGFIGLESVTVASEHVKNPERTIPIATISGVLITALIYICGAIAIAGLVPHGELLVSNAPYVDAGEKIFGNLGKIFMIITGVLGIYGSLNGWILLQGEVPHAAAKEGLFPRYFLKTNKHGAPVGVTVGSILMIFVFLLTYQESFVEHVKLLIDVSVLAMLLPYFYSAIAFCYLAVCKKKELSNIEKILLTIIGFVSVIYAFFAIFGSGKEIIFLGTIMFLISVPFYCFIKKS